MSVIAEIGSAYISLIPSARGFGRATSSQVNPQLSRSGAAAGGVFGKSMLKGFLAIGAGVAIARFLGDSVAEARDAQKVAALTANVIKTTGGAAKVAAVQVERLSTALSKKVGIDDEEIQAGSNLILTFKNIKREGTGLNNIFARATRAGVDLAASGFGSIESASKQVGKALNDPIKGLTALSRAGVTFSKQQETQIKNAVANNNVLRAQRIILAEVESQVGGAAQAQATNADRARVALGNLKEQIGTALLPALDAMSALFANKIAPAISNFITGLQGGQGAAGGLGNFIRTDLVPVLKESLPPILKGVRDAFDQVRRAIRDNKPQLIQIGNAIKALIPVVALLAGKWLKELGFQIRVVITVVGLVVRQFNVLKGVGTAIGTVILRSAQDFAQFGKSVPGAVGKVWTALRQGAARVKEVVTGVFTSISAAIQGAIDKVQSLIDKIAEVKGKGGSGTKWPTPTGSKRTNGPVAGISGGTKNDIAAAYGIMARVTSGAERKVDEASKKLKDKISKVRDQLTSARSDFASLVEPIASNFTQGLFDFDTAGAFSANLTTVKGTLTTLLANFKTLISEGLKPGFLYQLFQSGGPGLINSLAGLDAATAQGIGSQFADVMSLSDQLGTNVAGATDKGAALENQTVRLERKLEHLIKAVKDNKQNNDKPAANARRRHRKPVPA